MRKIQHNGKTAYITEKDWKSLLRRFDERNAKEIRLKFTIEIPCCLCEKYYFNEECEGCPLQVFYNPLHPWRGCSELLKSVISKEEWGCFAAYIYKIQWHRKNYISARSALKKIHNALLALPRK